MANTSYKLKQVVDDLKTSWFFRVWALFWLVGAILGFAALIMFGGTSSEAQKHLDSTIWWENASSTYFPRFHFRVDPQYESLLTVTCDYQGTPVPNTDCTTYGGDPLPSDICLAVTADTIQVFNRFREHRRDDTIHCNITTIPQMNNTNTLIAWELEDPQLNVAIDPGSYAGLWMAPRVDTWVVLVKNVATFDKKPLNLWDRNLFYHSTGYNLGFYDVTVSLSGFGVFHFGKQSFYSPWRAFADIGGFAFFLFCFHTLTMIIIGLCLPQSSNFLEGGERSLSITSEQQYTKM